MIPRRLWMRWCAISVLVFVVSSCQRHTDSFTTSQQADVPRSEEPLPPPRSRNRGTHYRSCWAIVVGINKYSPEKNGLDPLDYPVHDAQDFARILRDEFGYVTSDENGSVVGENILLLTDHDATRDAIERAFEEWLPGKHQHLLGDGLLAEDDAVLVFFAGHGLVDWEHPDKPGYLAAVDSQRDAMQETCIPVTWGCERLRELKCRHKAIILDSCYSGSLFLDTGPTVEMAFEGPSDGADAAAPGIEPAFWGMCAGLDTPVVDGRGDGSHSAFTAALLQELSERCNSDLPGEYFKFRTLADRVQVRMEKRPELAQRPDSGRLREADGTIGNGEYLFFPTVDVVTPRELGERRRLVSAANRLALESRRTREEYPTLGLLLAIEAVEIGQQFEDLSIENAEQALREALAQVGGYVLGDYDSVASMAMSPGENWVVTGNVDGNVRVWDLSNPDLPVLTLPLPDVGYFQFSGVHPQIGGVFVSANHRWVAAGLAGKIVLWDLTTKDNAVNPKVFRDPEPLRSSGPIGFKHVVVSDDDRWLIAQGRDSCFRWDLAAQNPTADRRPMHSVTLQPSEVVLVDFGVLCYDLQAWQHPRRF